MKTPRAEKLPSGKYRARLQVDNQRFSATGATKKEAQDNVMKKYLGFCNEKRVPLTVGEAMDRYIKEKEGTLSPSTIKGYLAIRRNYLQGIMKINLTDLTQGDIQMAVSQDFINKKSPKTVRNAHGLLASVLDEFRPNFVLKTRLPQKEKKESRIFTEEEMQKVWQAAKGDKYELPILLASWLGLRMSEVRGIKYRDISNGKIHIHCAVVRGPKGHVEKGPKTISGDRWIKLPEEIDLLIKVRKYLAEIVNPYFIEEHRICPWADTTIYKNFIRICKKAGVEPCTFHQLRHFAASEAMALGVPDKYSQKRMGHATDNMLKSVYQHTQRVKEDEFADLIDKKMSSLYNNGHKSGHGE